MSQYGDALNELARLATENAEAHGFQDDLPTDPHELAIYNGNSLMLIVSELAEAFEELRAGRGVTETYYSSALPGELVLGGVGNQTGIQYKPEGIPSEIADALIRLLHFSGRCKIDLEIVPEKMAYNATRPHKHGKKF